MKYLLIIPLAIIVLIIAFVIWFLVYRSNGKCPLCALEKLTKPTKVTMNISEDEDFNNGAAVTPPMGWSSWNTFRQNISEDIILSTAKAMKNSGLLNAGYKYINLDDCWHSSARDKNGNLQGDLSRFPHSIKSLISDINDMGMKVGLYSSNGTLTCEDLPAGLGNEERDAKTVAQWGCEFFKYDYCHHEKISGEAPIITGLQISRCENGTDVLLSAEDAEFSGRARCVKVKKLNNTKGIGFINHGAGKATFKVSVNENGDYALTLLIHKRKSRKKQYLQVIVNGQTYEVFFPETKGFSPTGRAQVVVNLKGGENTLVLQNPVKTNADSSYIQYRRMGKALQKAVFETAQISNKPEKPIVYSICEWGTAHPWNWGAKAGNMWRTTPDILANWFSIHHIYSKTISLYKSAGKGHWNDPDMLEVGNGKLTEEENRTHFSLWCMLAAPLILGNDIRTFVDSDGNAVKGNATLETVTNKNLIDIDQDELGKPAKKIKSVCGVDVLARPLSGGETAICFYNKSFTKRRFSFNINSILADEYINGAKDEKSHLVHDLWFDKKFTCERLEGSLPKHGCKVYRICNTKN